MKKGAEVEFSLNTPFDGKHPDPGIKTPTLLLAKMKNFRTDHTCNNFFVCGVRHRSTNQGKTKTRMTKKFLRPAAAGHRPTKIYREDHRENHSFCRGFYQKGFV